MIIAGYPSLTIVEQYDGSSWTGTGAMTFAGRDFTGGGVGISTAALQIGGFISPGNLSATMQTFDGSSWTEVAETNEIKNIMGSGGTATAGIIYGGAVHPNPAPTATANVEYWNGSGLSEPTTMNQARSYLVGLVTQT